MLHAPKTAQCCAVLRAWSLKESETTDAHPRFFRRFRRLDRGCRKSFVSQGPLSGTLTALTPAEHRYFLCQQRLRFRLWLGRSLADLGQLVAFGQQQALERCRADRCLPRRRVRRPCRPRCAPLSESRFEQTLFACIPCPAWLVPPLVLQDDVCSSLLIAGPASSSARRTTSRSPSVFARKFRSACSPPALLSFSVKAVPRSLAALALYDAPSAPKERRG